jgi:hypothetical protein
MQEVNDAYERSFESERRLAFVQRLITFFYLNTVTV